MAHHWVAVVVLISCLNSTEANPAQNPARLTTCSTYTDDVMDKGTATLTCHFGDDVIRQRPLSVSVEFYQQGKEYSVAVVECMWLSKADEEFTCPTINKNRYSFTQDPHTPGDMTLTIRDVTTNDVGRYVCQHISPDTPSARFKPCTLSGEGFPTGPSDTTNSADNTGHPESTTKETGSGFPVVGEKESEEEPFLAMPLLVAVIVGSVLLALLLVMLTVFLVRRRRRSRENRPPEEVQSNHITEGDAFLPESDERVTETEAERAEPEAERTEPEAGMDENAKEEEKKEEEEEEEEKEEEEEEKTSDDEVVSALNKGHFDLEVRMTAATMQLPIKRKMSTGDYPLPGMGNN